MLWQFVGGVLTWSKVAELLEVGVPEMTEQLHLAHRLIQRYGRTGRVLFDGPDLQLARTGVEVMDALAEECDQLSAIAAAEWAENRLNALVQEQQAAAV